MTGGYVFDTEPIIAFLYSEPGHNAVAERLGEVFAGDTDGFLTETNASEVFYLVARFEGVDDGPTDADRDVRALERQGLQLEAADWRLAAIIKPVGTSHLPMHTPLRSRTSVTRRSFPGPTMTSTSYLSMLTCTDSEITACSPS